MVAHNKNYKPAPKLLSKPARNPRYAQPKDEVSHLWETDLICELANPSNSLEDICAAQGISLEALSLWMARPDVAQRLDLVQTTAMNRARFIGRLTLPTAAQSAANIINAHKLRPQKPTIDSAFNTELHRANENMLKAARFLQRLTAEPAPRRSSKSELSNNRKGADGTIRSKSQSYNESTAAPKTQIGGDNSAQTNVVHTGSTDERSRESVVLSRHEQGFQPGAHQKSKRPPRRNSTAHSKKVRTRTPPRTTRNPPSPTTQSRGNASSTPVPKASSSSPLQLRGAPPHRARTAENSAAPLRPPSRSSTPRSASG